MRKYSIKTILIKIIPLLFIGAAPLNGQGLIVNGQKYDLSMFPVFVLPGERVEVRDADNPANIKVVKKAAQIEITGNETVKLKAPKDKGIYPVTFSNRVENLITIKIVVLVSAAKIGNGRLNNFRIGPYPDSKKKIYEKPGGFIEVTAGNIDTFLTPHFKLSQFLCKQNDGFPKYLVLAAKLLIKLEKILEKYNSGALKKADTFFIMSGYRTPYYNKVIKNVKFSRHIYGDASDFYVDVDNDGYTDDLDGNGQVNQADMDVLKKIVEEIDNNKLYKSLLGGLGTYRATSMHGPFIHVDTRGYIARW